MEPSSLIRNARRLQGLTQTELAFRSGVSLPTVQNIEAGRANPSFSTLHSVMNALGLELSAGIRPADWDGLARFGAPHMILESRSGRTGLLELRRRTAESLLSNLRDACMELRDDPEGSNTGRKRESVQALLMAIQIHFPGFHDAHLAGAELYEDMLGTPITGRTIRLVRASASILAGYL